ncbi:predicted protein [Scheffersomyces stipitis CBS 6054]|uniref:Ribonuclease n=1 Tax=Scheffersomyces stipitis (strain ATCC 58785 / CBS 6054 / NBRC 10063 / NRRL Y-11545) TaxID=322104 RepID=A3LSC6_PICST|nr:predicted protein [Scheffersomyces stipitis CBS 6054]ABN65548.2 predicted protein [Scheffersomyces stipitis CBS 6054]
MSRPSSVEAPESESARKRRKLETGTASAEEAGDSRPYPLSVTSIENHFEFKSSTYHSAIPVEVLENPDEPVVLGVDEAGRGPVLGPMVYGIAFALEKYSTRLQKEYGFADSKTLKEEKRDELFYSIEDEANELNRNVGWATTTMTARDISSGMLRSVLGIGNYNLNEQAHDTTIQLIKEVIAKGVNVKKIYVDTVGPPVTYQAKLQKIFPETEVTVAKKADSIYPIVSTASVMAKVTRDANIRWYNHNLDVLKGHKLGSGYPSDPNTSKWLNGNVDKVFGWCYGFIRFSWQTAKDSLVKHDGVEVIYEDECVKQDNGYGNVSEYFSHKDEPVRGSIDKLYYSSGVKL